MDVNREYLKQYVDKDTLYNHCKWVVDSVEKSWSSRIPRSVVMNDVFPFTVLTEPAFVDVRLREKFLHYARNIYIENCKNTKTVECAVKFLNEKLYDITTPPIVFEPAPPNTLNSYGIEELFERKKGSCTSMSVFLITGLRSIGVPARIAGVPHWNLSPSLCPDGDDSPSCGNHNWVEVYVPPTTGSGGWSFVDQRRPDLAILPLNQSWFFPDHIADNTIPGQGNHSVYAASFMPVSALMASKDEYPIGAGVLEADHFPMVWDWPNHSISAWDVSAAYRNSTDTYVLFEYRID
jgi:hypothetical protein